MSYDTSLLELKNKINIAMKADNKNLELVKIYSSYYFFTKNILEKKSLINDALLLVKEETNILKLLRYILIKNIIIEKNYIVMYNWIFINENVIIRKIRIKKCNKGYLIINKEDSLPIHYLNLLNS